MFLSRRNLVLLLIMCVTILFAYVFMVYGASFGLNLEKKHPLDTSAYFSEYIRSIDPALYSIKVKGFTSTKMCEFTSAFKERVHVPSSRETLVLNTCAFNADIKIAMSGLHGLCTIPWRFLVSEDSINKGMPFTLGEYIIVNKSMISEVHPLLLIETLIHEKLHVLQRMRQHDFNEFYIKIYPFLYERLPLDTMPKEIRERYMTNPDNNLDYWIYAWGESTYYSYLKFDFDTGNASDCFVNTTTGEESDGGRLREEVGLVGKGDACMHHPNEIFAYTISDMVMTDSLDATTKGFLNSLCAPVDSYDRSPYQPD